MTANAGRFGAGLSALVEIAVPARLGGEGGQRLLAALVIVEAFLAVAGLGLGYERIGRLGIATLAFTLGTYATAYLLGDFVARRRGWRWVLAGATAVAAAGALRLAGLVAWYVLGGTAP